MQKLLCKRFWLAGGCATTEWVCMESTNLHFHTQKPPPNTWVLKGEARLLRDEAHRVALELQQRQLVLQKLHRKHEALVLKGRGEDGGWLGGWMGRLTFADGLGGIRLALHVAICRADGGRSSDPARSIASHQ